MKEAFHDLVWHVEERDRPVCLWVIGMLVQLQEGDDLGMVPYFWELEQAEINSKKRSAPFLSLAALLLYELRVDVVEPGSFAWFQMFDRRYNPLMAEVSREVGICIRCSA